MIIQQGDQYNIPVKIKYQNTYLTPTNVDDIRIKVGNRLLNYVNGDITFNSSTNEWNYPLSHEQSVVMNGCLTYIQVGFKKGNEEIYSPTETVYVGQSIIKEDW